MNMRGFDFMGNWDGSDEIPYAAPAAYDYASDPSAYNDNVFWMGNDTSSSTVPKPNDGVYDPNLGASMTDAFIPDAAAPLTAEQSQRAAAQLALSTAANGGSVSPQVVATWQSQGIDISNMVTAAGAIFKYVQQAGGKYTAVPVNAQAQQQLAANQAQSKMLLFAGLGLLAFAFLKG